MVPLYHWMLVSSHTDEREIEQLVVDHFNRRRRRRRCQAPRGVTVGAEHQ